MPRLGALVCADVQYRDLLLCCVSSGVRSSAWVLAGPYNSLGLDPVSVLRARVAVASVCDRAGLSRELERCVESSRRWLDVSRFIS